MMEIRSVEQWHCPMVDTAWSGQGKREMACLPQLHSDYSENQTLQVGNPAKRRLTLGSNNKSLVIEW